MPAPTRRYSSSTRSTSAPSPPSPVRSASTAAGDSPPPRRAGPAVRPVSERDSVCDRGGMRVVAVAVSSAVAALAIVAAAASGSFQQKGTVTHVVDGDTVDVQLGNRIERVRVIGIDTPERGECWAPQATAATRSLAQGKAVTLVGDATQDTRDRYGRLLAYV